jgi:hypothetical protein
MAHRATVAGHWHQSDMVRRRRAGSAAATNATEDHAALVDAAQAADAADRSGCGRSGGAGAATWMRLARRRRRRGGIIRRHFSRDVAGPADAVALVIGEQLLGAHGPGFEIAQHAIHQGGQRRCAGDRLRRVRPCRAIIGAGRPTCLGTPRCGSFIAEIGRGSAVHSLWPFTRRWRVRPSLVFHHRRRPQSGSGQPEARSP